MNKTQLSGGGITFNTDRWDIKVGGKEIKLCPKEAEILKEFMLSDGKVLNREHFLNTVWGHEKGLDLQTRTVDQHITRLRRKLGKAGGSIVTVTSKGYKFKK